MKKLILLPFLGLLFIASTSFDKANQDNSYFPCSVTVTETDPETGESFSATYVSHSRTDQFDCLNGINAFLAGNFMQSSDFKRSPVIAPAD